MVNLSKTGQAGEIPGLFCKKRNVSAGQFKEVVARVIFTLTACISILAVALICIFLFANGIPGMTKIGIWEFLSGQKWKPGNEIFGVLPFIMGSIYVTAGALIVGVPAGLLTALFMSRFASKKIVRIMRPAVSLVWWCLCRWCVKSSAARVLPCLRPAYCWA